MKRYQRRDTRDLDRKGNYYSRHVTAMTGEGLHEKSAIAAELAYRDYTIDELREIIDGQIKIIKRHQKIEAALKVISIWALHPDEDTLKQIHHRAMEALGE